VVHQFHWLAALKGVVHGVSTRTGGVSVGPYASLNLGLHVGDSADRVLENRRRFCAALGIAPESVVAARQSMGAAVAYVTEADRGRGALTPESALPSVDGLVTEARGVALAGFSADCPLVALVDPVRRAIGLAHASRRGTFGRVTARAVAAMQRLLGCRPADMFAAIGPSIGPCCYEVGPEVEAEARDQAPEAEAFFVRRRGALHFDLWAANRAQLVAAGLPPAHVELADACTQCHAATFYSYRAARGTTGRFALVISLAS
jgi:YfiH family protein